MFAGIVDDIAHRVFAQRLVDRTPAFGVAAFLVGAGFLLAPFDGGRLRITSLFLAGLCVWLCGYRTVFTLENASLLQHWRWFHWPIPTFFGGTPPKSLGAPQELRCGRAMGSAKGMWLVDVITPSPRPLRLHYDDEAQMRADLDAICTRCPALKLVWDDVEGPRDREATPILTRATSERNAALGMAAVYAIGGLIAVPFGELPLAGFGLLCACALVCVAGFRARYALAGTHVEETVHWYRLRTRIKRTHGFGIGALREVRATHPHRKRLALTLYTSGGAVSRTYRDEAARQADLDELRALCPKVPIVRR